MINLSPVKKSVNHLPIHINYFLIEFAFRTVKY